LPIAGVINAFPAEYILIASYASARGQTLFGREVANSMEYEAAAFLSLLLLITEMLRPNDFLGCSWTKAPRNAQCVTANCTALAAAAISHHFPALAGIFRGLF